MKFKKGQERHDLQNDTEQVQVRKRKSSKLAPVKKEKYRKLRNYQYEDEEY